MVPDGPSAGTVQDLFSAILKCEKTGANLQPNQNPTKARIASIFCSRDDPSYVQELHSARLNCHCLWGFSLSMKQSNTLKFPDTALLLEKTYMNLHGGLIIFEKMKRTASRQWTNNMGSSTDPQHSQCATIIRNCHAVSLQVA